MILVRTPFRLSLGGGSTDLPAYYKEYGGFIFAVTINLYMYLGLNRPPTDNKIRLKYNNIICLSPLIFLSSCIFFKRLWR